ncbi:hypothetical protein GCM10009827_101850 [Dactylosporangium maewongense]|uniref:Uncharacterized protein n=1 Tax=Dactylosporangium maewongense TaxID=634393 RepID=A0ABN2CV58_9ACTN
MVGLGEADHAGPYSIRPAVSVYSRYTRLYVLPRQVTGLVHDQQPVRLAETFHQRGTAASQTAVRSNRCIGSACSARTQQVFDSTSDKQLDTIAAAVRRGSTRANRPSISSSAACQPAGPVLPPPHDLQLTPQAIDDHAVAVDDAAKLRPPLTVAALTQSRSARASVGCRS